MDNIEKINIISYEPAFSIIGNASKRNPTCRQSADHSMVYIIATLLRKAFEKYDKIVGDHSLDELWKYLMLTPFDYGKNAIFNETTRKLMDKIHFEHGGPEYDAKYPEGIPTSIQIFGKGQAPEQVLDSGLIMFPGGHSKNHTVTLHDILQRKFKALG
jgi:2-methylcitrate dehydratase